MLAKMQRKLISPALLMGIKDHSHHRNSLAASDETKHIQYMTQQLYWHKSQENKNVRVPPKSLCMNVHNDFIHNDMS